MIGSLGGLFTKKVNDYPILKSLDKPLSLETHGGVGDPDDIDKYFDTVL